MPLTLAEVRLYVQHRLQVAGCLRPVFTDAAVKKLFELSGGIPRLLNLLCDRAMLGGYSQQQAMIDAPLVTMAAAEILALPTPANTNNVTALPRWVWPLFSLLCLAVGIFSALWWQSRGVS